MKIFIQKFRDKFISNLIATTTPNLSVLNGDINGDLYKNYYRYNFDVYFFISSLWNNEIDQFVSELSNSVKVIIYHPNNGHPELSSRFNNATHLCATENSFCETIPSLINEQTFWNKAYQNRLDITACFIDNPNNMPKNIQNILYPNTKNKIHLFADGWQHPQNLGAVSEQDKAEILNNYKHYLCLDHLYRSEAWACGAKVLSLAPDGSFMEVKEEVYPETYQNFLYRFIS
jgi:hypothetical protein